MTSDEKTLEESGVKEGDFLVVTVTVVKKTTKPIDPPE